MEGLIVSPVACRLVFAGVPTLVKIKDLPLLCWQKQYAYVDFPYPFELTEAGQTLIGSYSWDDSGLEPLLCLEGEIQGDEAHTNGPVPMDRPKCQCACNCGHRPGSGCRRICLSCSRLIGPGCCWMGDNIRLCHICFHDDGNV